MLRKLAESKPHDNLMDLSVIHRSSFVDKAGDACEDLQTFPELVVENYFCRASSLCSAQGLCHMPLRIMGYCTRSDLYRQIITGIQFEVIGCPWRIRRQHQQNKSLCRRCPRLILAIFADVRPAQLSCFWIPDSAASNIRRQVRN
jgi:hypothetical protein